MVQGASLSDCDVDRYVIIRKLRDFIFNIRWETKSPYGDVIILYCSIL
jgi:hypothetical protein